jgi:CRISPR-associated endonuclease/helicase Cas3
VSNNTAIPLTECLAKTYGEKGNKQKGRDVLTHCQIVGEVARELINRMPELLKNTLFPHGSELIAACHDIGKVSPTFQKMLYDDVKEFVAELKNIDAKSEKEWGGHAYVSFATAKKLKLGAFIPKILGQHHGSLPESKYSAFAEVFGGETWQQRRVELVEELKKSLRCDFPKVENQEHSLVLAGLTSVSDWIGSQELFDNPADDWEQQRFIKKAVDEAGFVHIQPEIIPNLTFFDIFNFHPHDTQTRFFESVTQTGVYILEAPMGLGKTEAALYAAYRLLVADKATGIYFALPTQLTSDKIYDRFNDTFLSKILSSDNPLQKALLAHSNAWLRQTDLGENANPDGVWFDSRKRKLLAPFAVGTIDQALMAIMNVRHGFVRMFGLAGKIVILDEVHSYDDYTGTILDELVKALRELHCTVIILSATLTKERREKFLPETVTVQKQSYPLISVNPNNGEFQELTVEPLKDKNVEIHCCQNDDEAIDEAVKRAEQGQQVLWIENTVAEAQEKFKVLSERANGTNVETGLLHSRFLKIDREDNENKWVDLYGKKNRLTRQDKGRILVASPVAEQSLDLDADFLVSRFAPTDMLLQRIGRLWRHEKSVRSDSAKHEAWFLTPELNTALQDAEKEFGKSAYVYSPYVLCRSLEVWHDLKSVDLPSQIRNLIEATYAKRDTEQDEMQTHFDKLEKKREHLNQIARSATATGLSTSSDDDISTRYIEQDTMPVLLLRGQPANNFTEITFLNGEKICLPHGTKAKDKKLWRESAAQLLKNTLHVMNCHAPQAVSTEELNWLKEFMFLGKFDGKSFLRVAIVEQSGEIKSLAGGAASDKYQLSYDERFGYRAEK